MADSDFPQALPPSVPPSERRQRPKRSSIDGQNGAGNAEASVQPPIIPASIPASNQRPLRRSAFDEAAPQRTSVPPQRGAAPQSMPPAYAPRRAQPTAVPPVQEAARPVNPVYVPAAQAARPQQAPSYAPQQQRPGAASPSWDQLGIDDSGNGRGKTRRRRKRRWPVAVLVVLALIIAWPAWLIFDTNRHLTRVDALVPGTTSPGTTYLLAGSDQRAEGDAETDVIGQRSDSIILIHVAPNGQASMVSLPRDTYVDIPEYGYNKLNAAFSFGGPALLVETVQNLTGIGIDHYVEVNMQGFGPLVDAVGGVELCMDYDAVDPDSGLNWQAGCHQADGQTALSFARMRYQDPRGDIGRTDRQRQVIDAVANKALSPATLINPFQQQRLAKTGAATLTVDKSSNVIDIARLLLAFRSAGKSGLSGTPPLASLAEETDVGEVVLLDEDLAPDFFNRLAEGQLVAEDFSPTQ